MRNEHKLTSEQKLMYDLHQQTKSMDKTILMFMELEDRDVRYALEVWDDIEELKAPVLYEPSMDNVAMNFCLLGATNKELAAALDIHETTVTAWLKRYPSFRKAVFDGREGADAKVARSLYNRAIGSSVKEVKFATHEGLITDTKEFDKQYPPDVTAARLWLFNRDRARWNSEGTTTQDVNLKGELSVRDLSREELEEEAARLGFTKRASQLTEKEITDG